MAEAPSPQIPDVAPAPVPAPGPHPVDFPGLYKREFSYVWRTLRRLGVLERDLADLTHDFFVVVFRHLHQYDPARPVKPWLFGIAFRVVADYRKSARFKHEILEQPPDVADDGPAADDHVATAQARALVTKVLDGLDFDRRAVFVMHELDGHPIPEVAGALAVPVATAYSRLRLAREDVAAAMKRLRAREERGRP